MLLPSQHRGRMQRPGGENNLAGYRRFKELVGREGAEGNYRGA